MALGGRLPFGIARVSAYGTTSYAQNPGVTKDKRSQWQIGASTPIGSKGTLALNYAHATIDYNTAADDDKVSFWGIGYQHSLSKRTNLYAAYGDINRTIPISSNRAWTAVRRPVIPGTSRPSTSASATTS